MIYLQSFFTGSVLFCSVLCQINCIFNLFIYLLYICLHSPSFFSSVKYFKTHFTISLLFAEILSWTLRYFFSSFFSYVSFFKFHLNYKCWPLVQPEDNPKSKHHVLRFSLIPNHFLTVYSYYHHILLISFVTFNTFYLYFALLYFVYNIFSMLGWYMMFFFFSSATFIFILTGFLILFQRKHSE